VARVVVGAAVVLLAATLLAGVGTAATPLLARGPAGPVVDSLLGRGTVGSDPEGFVREQGVPVPELPPCVPAVRACVDLAANQAWLVDKGHVVRGPVPIVSGDPENPTPRGAFVVQWKAEHYTSREFLVQMPWSVFFADGGIAFHAGDTDTYSAGCVKLADDDARAFFEFLQVGDPVQVL
jgi:hypothetical protein